jgi:hypothetical protein
MGWFNDNMDPDRSEFGFKPFPDHIDPCTGYTKTGYRKCSECTAYKYRTGFTKEESKKPAAKRLCNACIEKGAALSRKAPQDPSASKVAAKQSVAKVVPLRDIDSISIKEMKQELQSLGICTKSIIEKGELVDALANARAREQSPSSRTLSLEDILSLKVPGLKEELKARGLPVSGLKPVLQQRLTDAVGVSAEPTTSTGAEASVKNAPVENTITPKTMSQEKNKENYVPRPMSNVPKEQKKTACSGGGVNMKQPASGKCNNFAKEQKKTASFDSGVNIKQPASGNSNFGDRCKSASDNPSGGYPSKSNGGGDGKKLPYPCKFFPSGQCRYGDACRFSHEQATGTGAFGSGNGTSHAKGGYGRGGSIWSHPAVVAGMKNYRASKESWDWNR